ncbi:MAG: DUF3127 domain-containing protein [Cyclonatronaceae bacterium]
MELNIQGKVVEVLEEQSGEGRNGPWRRRDFILEMNDRFSKKVCVSQWGDAIDNDPVSPGEDLKVFINLQSREYNGRWYTDVRAWRIDRDGGTPAADSGFPNDPASGMGNAPDMGSADPSSQGFNPKKGGPGRDPNTLSDNLEDVDDDLPF